MEEIYVSTHSMISIINNGLEKFFWKIYAKKDIFVFD